MPTSLTRRDALQITWGALGALSLLGCPDSEGEGAGRPLPAMSLSEPIAVSGALLGVWGEPDGSRVWMVGGRVEEDGSATRHVAVYERDASGGQGRLSLHWSAPGAPLWWVWGDGLGGVWAGGEGGGIVRLSGDEWLEEEVLLEGELRDKAIIWGIWGEGGEGGSIWAVGGSYRRGGPRGLLLKRTPSAERPSEGSWLRVDEAVLPTELPDEPTAGLNLFKIWGEGPEGPAWVVGEGGAALYWPEGLSGPVSRLEPPATDLMFTVHGSRESEERIAVGGYQQASAWRWRSGAWEPLALERGVSPLNGVSVSGAWAHLVGAMGMVTRCWLGAQGQYRSTQETLRVTGAEGYTLHAVWSPEPSGAEGSEGPPAPIFIVGGDLESRREGVILMSLTRPPVVEPW